MKTEIRQRELLLPKGRFPHFTHYVFRFPAKFHPPVVKRLIEAYTKPGETILDPFCGSGTLLVEAMVAGRHSIGIDIDPVAASVAAAKTHRYSPNRLNISAAIVLELNTELERKEAEYLKRMFVDISDRSYLAGIKELAHFIPDIPNIRHWFRNYVVIDLAVILRNIEAAPIPQSHRQFFRVILASIIRNCSNADPVPVSGLEVTAHMRKIDEQGRLINPFQQFRKAVERSLVAAASLYGSTNKSTVTSVRQGDAYDLPTLKREIDAIITSPPYNGAVDYYRRHQLEMFWLGHTSSHAQRLKLLDHYIGRPKIPKRNQRLLTTFNAEGLVSKWDSRMRLSSHDRANAFRHYMASMQRVFEQMSSRLTSGKPAIIVVGRSSWNQSAIPTELLFKEISAEHFVLDEHLHYPVKNRYMSYSRHNNASIDTEHVLVFRRRKSGRSMPGNH